MKNSLELFSLKGQVALITGATGYLGSEIAFALAEAGAHIWINSRSKSRVDILVKKMLDKGLSVEPAVFDATKEGEISNFFATKCNCKLNILVNNAYAGLGGTISTASASEYKDSYDVTLIGAHNIFTAALPHLRLAVRLDSEASIINVGTMYGMVSPDIRIYSTSAGSNPPFYGAAKAALLQWTKYAACEFGREGIRINSISPGPFPSKEVQDADQEFIQKLCNKVPLGRIGLSQEIRGPMLFLASHASSYVNGANLCVDGGWTAW